MSEPRVRIEVAAHEPRDVGERFIWGMVGVCLAGLVACALIVVGMYPKIASDRIITLPLPVYPTPRLQTHPAADARAFRERQLRQLNGSGWIDRPHGIAHIPITTAMQQLADEGIAGWPAP
ncbi:MAG TPA: hypothetical protein VMF03_01100 [Steroidobacteraceae bacterium]|nr:hypothetical protein [Steroidobacteraceae bacterium]